MDKIESGGHQPKSYMNTYEQYKQKNAELMNKYKQYAEQYKTYQYTPVKAQPKKTIVSPITGLLKIEMSKEEFDDLYSKALEAYMLGVKGDADAVKKAGDMFKKLCSADPQNYVVEAYYGCAVSLLGRDIIDPNERFKYAMKGLKLLDHAVQSASGNVEIRSLRASVCSRLPEMYFHRTSTAIEDYKYILSLYEKDRSCISEEQYCQYLFDLGNSYKTLNKFKDAQAVWEKLMTVTRDPKFIKLLKNAGVNIQEEAGSDIHPEPVEPGVPFNGGEQEEPLAADLKKK